MIICAGIKNHLHIRWLPERERFENYKSRRMRNYRLQTEQHTNGRSSNKYADA